MLRVKRRALFMPKGNSKPHEEKKFEICFALNQMGHEWITEAADCSTGLIRDVVDLNTGEVWECETDPKRAIRFLDESTKGYATKVHIVPVGWKFTDKKWIELKEKFSENKKSI